MGYNTTIKKREIPEGKECLHLMCGSTCRRPLVPKKIPKPLKRTPLKRSTKSIAKVSLKNKKSEKNSESWVNLRDELDLVFSRYIRVKYSNEEGVCKCFTCNKELRWQDMQNGHYVSRNHYSTRYLELNCRPQDPTCNELLNGNLWTFAERLEAEQEGSVRMLEEKSREVLSLSCEDLKELIFEYRNKLKIAKLKFKQ